MASEQSPRSVKEVIENPTDGSVEVIIRSGEVQLVLEKLGQSEYVCEFEERPFNIVRVVLPQTHLENVTAWSVVDSVQVNQTFRL